MTTSTVNRLVRVYSQPKNEDKTIVLGGVWQTKSTDTFTGAEVNEMLASQRTVIMDLERKANIAIKTAMTTTIEAKADIAELLLLLQKHADDFSQHEHGMDTQLTEWISHRWMCSDDDAVSVRSVSGRQSDGCDADVEVFECRNCGISWGE